MSSKRDKFASFGVHTPKFVQTIKLNDFISYQILAFTYQIQFINGTVVFQLGKIRQYRPLNNQFIIILSLDKYKLVKWNEQDNKNTTGEGSYYLQ